MKMDDPLLVGTVMVGLTTVVVGVVVQTLLETVGRADLEGVHTVCAGLWGCGGSPEGWWLTAAGLLVVPLLALGVHYRRPTR